MSRFVTFVLYLISALVLTCLVGVAVLWIVLDPETVKHQLSEQFQKHTQRTLTIHGAPQLTFFPWLGLAVTDLQIANPDGFSQEIPFAQIGSARFYLSLKALLQKKVTVEEINLRDARIYLQVDEAGRSNWADLLQHSTKDSSSSSEPSKPISSKILLPTIHQLAVHNAQITLHNAQTKQTITLSQFQLMSQNIRAEQPFPLDFSVHLLHPTWQGQLAANTHITVDPIAQTVQMKPLTIHLMMDGPTAPRPLDLQLTTQATIDPERMALTDIIGKLNQTTVTGTWQTQWSTRHSTFNLTLDRLNTDDFIPAPVIVQEQAASYPNQATVQTETDLLPVAFWRDLNHSLSGQLAIQQIQAPPFIIADLNAKLSLDNQTFALDPIAAHIQQGTLYGNLIIERVDDAPKWRSQWRLQDLNIEPLLQKLEKPHGFSVTGRLAANADLMTAGHTAYQIRQNLNGKADFALTKGVLKGIDLQYQIQRINAFINQQSLAEQDDQATAFTHLSGSFVIHHGLAHNKDLTLAAEVIQASGTGTINLVDQTLDYQLAIRLDDPALGRDAYRIQDVLGGSLPLKVSGSFAQFRVEPDWKKIGLALTMTTAKHHLEKTIGTPLPEQTENSPEEFAKKGIGKALNKLFRF